MTVDLSQFHQMFFEEAGEHLANMESLLLGLDTEAPSLEDLNAIFRAAHSIKGSSGTFGFTDMTEVTHILETLLDRLRKEELKLRPEMVDAFLAAGDVLRTQLEHHEGGPEADPENIRSICETLEALSHDQPAAEPQPVSEPAAESSAKAARTLRLECVLPLEVVQSKEAVDNLLEGLSEVVACQLLHRPEPDDARLAALVTTTLPEDEIREVLSFYVDPDELALHPEEEQAEYGFFDAAPAADEAGYGFFEDAPGRPESGQGAAAEPGNAPAALEGDGYGLFANAPGAPEAADPTAAAGRPGQSPGRRASDNPKAEVAKSGRRATDKNVTSAAHEASSIRVSVEKVDQLINLVGELVITQAMIADAAGYLDPLQAEKLLSGIDLLSRNTRDLQESVMSIRMLPMSMVFSRFPRVVRDLAGKFGKQVELKTVGENTELDKGLIEKITDPLTHLIRNSLDHGLETPEQRVAAGKPPKGTITLRASHQGGNIVIEVLDDGAGLNRERILAKAAEKGLNAHDGLSDAEVWQFIMAPGFSTAEAVTDVSGRGVGMDVVKKNIEGMGGRVELESSPGLGTRISIRLPLTLAILDGMSVGVDGETFIVPLTAVVESLQPMQSEIKTMAGDSRVINIRGEYLPIIPLAEVFGQGEVDDLENGIVVVVGTDDSKAALFVDELLGQHQVVIKSLETNYRRVPGISGATIMGDGSVAFILDIAAIARLGLKNPTRRMAA